MSGESPCWIFSGPGWSPVFGSDAHAEILTRASRLVAVQVRGLPVARLPGQLRVQLAGLHVLHTARLLVRVGQGVVDALLADAAWCLASLALGLDLGQRFTCSSA